MFAVTLIAASLVGATAFVAPMRSGARSLSMVMDDRSLAFPFDPRPVNLDGTLAGDVGFDPAGFTNSPPKAWLIGGEENSIKWYREAEIVHSRVAMLAVVGMIFPTIFHFDGNPEVGVAADAFAELNPYKALTTVPAEGLWQISLIIFGIELARIKRVIRGKNNSHCRQSFYQLLSSILHRNI